MAYNIFDEKFEEKRVLYRNPKKKDFLDSSDPCSEKSFKEAYVISKISGWSTVLITGANGVGKSGYAKLIWNESPCRSGAPGGSKNEMKEMAFVDKEGILQDREVLEVNCAAFAKDLIAAELFGYKKGAYTGANCDHKGKIQVAAEKFGCLFLDEVGDLPLDAQAMLLRFFQNKEIQPLGCAEPGLIKKEGEKNSDNENFLPRKKLKELKVICATNKNLEEEVKKGNFREDLFHRINKFCVNVPPLCERPEDCAINFDNYFQDIISDVKKSLDSSMASKWDSRGLADWVETFRIDLERFDKLNRLHEYSWPGNFRELRNRMNQAFMKKIMEGKSSVIEFEDLFPEGIEAAKRSALREASADDVTSALAECGFPSLSEDSLPEFDLQECLDNLTKQYSAKALDQCDGNKTRAARLLGYSNYQMLDRRRAGKK